MSLRIILLCAILGPLAGCGKPSTLEAAPKVKSAVTEIPVNTSEADLASTLAALTQSLRKFSVEQRRVPPSLNDLVAAGYLSSLPQPPPGKLFSIDAKKIQVVLK